MIHNRHRENRPAMSLQYHTTHALTTATAMVLALMLWTSPAHARDARWVGETLNGRPCSSLAGAQTRSENVFDYTDPADRAQNLEIVEQYHFTESVRALEHPQTLNNLEYTLGRFPNHHQALYAMIRYATQATYAERAKREWERTYRGRESQPPECYLQRAMYFAPGDHRVRTLAGLYFHRVEEYDRAKAAYERALEMTSKSAEAHYNFGLLLTDMEQFDAARKHARRAYELGYPLEGLRRRLASAGHPLND